MNEVRAAKLSGAGNDFVAVDAAERQRLGECFPDWVRAVCRRGVSIGADGVLVVDVNTSEVGVEFYNPDASRAFCGNGTRCAARFASRAGAGDTPTLRTDVGRVETRVTDLDVTLWLPFRPQATARRVESEGTSFDGWDVDAGCPHYVIETDSVARAPLTEWGPRLRCHPDFGPEGRNVDVWSRDTDHVRVRTWERGVEGETLACGSGAIAAAEVLRVCDPAKAEEGWTLLPASGVPLVVAFPDDGRTRLTGDARLLWEGRVASGASEGL